MKTIETAKPESVEPIPVKRLDDQVVFVDGHTRAFAAFLRGLTEIKVYWEDERLDWEAYRICVDWYKEEGIRTIADLRDRIVSPEEYEILWLERCSETWTRSGDGNGSHCCKTRLDKKRLKSDGVVACEVNCLAIR